MKQTIVIIQILLFLMAKSLYASPPDWSVSPTDYLHVMTVTGLINFDGSFSLDPNDCVAAFIDGECRGTVKLASTEGIDNYLAYLMVYNNDSDDTITFKLYNANQDSVIIAKYSLQFEPNAIIGGADEPYVWAAEDLSEMKELLSFTINDQFITTSFDDAIILMEVSGNTDLSNVVPEFELSDGANAYIDGLIQESGVSVVDFTNQVSYKIIAEDGVSTNIWTVVVSVIEGNDESSFTSQFKIYPNPVNEYLSIKSNNKDFLNYKFQIYNSCGEIVKNQSRFSANKNETTIINLSNLSEGIYFIKLIDGNQILSYTFLISR